MTRGWSIALFGCACTTTAEPLADDTDASSAAGSESATGVSVGSSAPTGDASATAEGGSDDATTQTATLDETSLESTASSDDATTAGGDGIPPIAEMMFPGLPGPLPSGTAFPLIGGGFAQGEALTTVELLVDNAVVGSGPAVPMLWNPADVDAGGMSSTEGIGDTGWIEFVVPSRLTHKVVGLAAQDTGPTAEDAHHRFYLTPNGNVFLRGFQPEGMYDAGDVFRIEVANGIVRFLHNGAEVHSEPRLPDPVPLVFDVLLNPSASLADAVMSVDGAAPIEPTWANLESAEAGMGAAVHWDSTSVSDGAHDFAVRVVDAGTDEATSAATHSFVDNAPPTCEIAEPLDGQIVLGMVDVTATALDLHLGTEALFVDGSLVLQTEGLDQVDYVWNTALVANGSHTLRFDVYDDAWSVTGCEIDVTVSN